MGNQVCCTQSNAKTTLESPSEPQIRRVVPIQESNEPPPQTSPQVQQVLNHQKLFQHEISTEKNPKVIKYGEDTYVGSLDKQTARPNGFGAMFRKDGGLFLGQFDNGRASGKGAYIFPNGAFYQGEFKQNKACSENGRFQSDEFTYQGGFKDNKFHGKAFERGKDYRFEGNFLHGSREKGQLMWNAEDGQYIYDGPFNDQNQFHGKGVLQEPKGRYEGPFVNGQKDGQFATYSSGNGTRYEGSYSNGYRSGYGTVYNNEGAVAYRGELRNGLPHGTGSIYNNGKEMKTTWVDGIDYNLLPQSLQ